LTDVRPLEDARAEDPNLEELRERVERLEEATDIDPH
ncbi:resolvase, partial [Halorubrum sp. SP3]